MDGDTVPKIMDAFAAPLYADHFCRSFLATINAIPTYYSTSRLITLRELAYMPKKFFLDRPEDGADKKVVTIRS